jgi:hypothetical protein
VGYVPSLFHRRTIQNTIGESSAIVVISCSTMKNLDMSAYLVISVNERTALVLPNRPRGPMDHHVSHHTYLKMHLVTTYWDLLTRSVGTLSSKKSDYHTT